MSAVFGDLNKGSDVTKGLRKVDKSEMTHKNPELRSSATVPSSGPGDGKPAVAKKPDTLAKKKAPPKKELDGTKWIVENFENDSSVVIEETEISQTVNLYGCKNTVVQVKGKVNAISVVSCSKTSILLDSTVSALSITSSPSFTVQILGTVPTILVDSTDGGQIYLSKDSLETELITSKTSGLNISVPKPKASEDEYDDFTELPVPEQLKTTVGKDGKLKTEVVEHAG